MGRSIPIELVENEKAEHDHGRWIGPELAHQKAGNKGELHHAVGEQIPGVEVLRRNRKPLRPCDQMVRDEVSIIFDQYALRDLGYPVSDRLVVGQD